MENYYYPEHTVHPKKRKLLVVAPNRGNCSNLFYIGGKILFMIYSAPLVRRVLCVILKVGLYKKKERR